MLAFVAIIGSREGGTETEVDEESFTSPRKIERENEEWC